MKVKIVKCSGDYWYKDKIGEVVEIEYCGNPNKYLLKDEELLNKKYYFLIDKSDCVEVVSEDQSQLNQAISLLQSHGYKVEAPYVDPTNEEICERVKAENEKVGYVVDWKDEYGNKYFINYDHTEKSYEYSSRRSYEMIGLVYTTKEIAEQIVDELNDGRFVRV